MTLVCTVVWHIWLVLAELSYTAVTSRARAKRSMWPIFNTSQEQWSQQRAQQPSPPILRANGDLWPLLETKPSNQIIWPWQKRLSAWKAYGVSSSTKAPQLIAYTLSFPNPFLQKLLLTPVQKRCKVLWPQKSEWAWDGISQCPTVKGLCQGMRDVLGPGFCSQKNSKLWRKKEKGELYLNTLKSIFVNRPTDLSDQMKSVLEKLDPKTAISMAKL